MPYNKTNNFSHLASEIRKTLANKKFLSNEELYINLVTLEESWRDLLLSSKAGKLMYEKFIDYILNERKNLLDARPFYRVRQVAFLNEINPYIRNKKPKKLYGQRINSAFILWVMDKYKGPNKKTLEKITEQIKEVRSDFVTKNFPLVLNRIKLSYNSSNLPMHDLIAIASGAALVALDKFAPSLDKDGNIIYTSVILSSIIARINAAITQNTENSALHLYPSDRKLFIEICRLKKDGLDDIDVGKKLDISEFEVSRFLHGIQVDSIGENAVFKEENISLMPDRAVEISQEQEVLKNSTDELSILEKKILILKGMLTYEV